MPLTLRLASQPRLLVHQQGSVPRRLARLADDLTPTLQRLWAALFADVRAALRLDLLRRALQAPHLLDVERYLLEIWEREVEDEVRIVLPVLVREQWVRVGAVLDEELEAVAGQPMTVQPDTPEAQDARQTAVGTQLVRITGTTLLGARHVLRGSVALGLGATAQAQRLRLLFGLTPSQVRQLDTAQVLWRAEGRSMSAIQTATAEAVTRGLAQRTRVIAETQAFGITNLGQRQAMTQALTLRPPTQPQVLRFWVVHAGACPLCTAIPGMNSHGVGLHSAFSTPEGEVFDPPMHAHCRCGVDYR
jgi:hypothetical protein